MKNTALKTFAIVTLVIGLYLAIRFWPMLTDMHRHEMVVLSHTIPGGTMIQAPDLKMALMRFPKCADCYAEVPRQIVGCKAKSRLRANSMIDFDDIVCDDGRSFPF